MMTAMKQRTASALLAVVLAFPGLAHATTYKFYTIAGPVGGEGSVVNGVAPDGSLAVGYSLLIGGVQTFAVSLTDPPTTTSITTGLQTADQLYGINDSGGVVGFQGNLQGTVRSPLTGSLSGSSVVGATVQPLPTGTDKTAFFLGVNDSGLAVGGRTDSAGVEHGVVFEVGAGTYSNITADAVSGGFDSLGELDGINDNGIAVGTYGNAALVGHAYIYNTQTQTPTLVPDVTGSQFTELSAINDSGVAAGVWVDANGDTFGILYNTLTDSYISTTISYPGAFGTEIDGIDNKGDLTGTYFTSNGMLGFIALVQPAPVPELPTWAMLIAGFAGLGVAGARGLGRTRRGGLAFVSKAQSDDARETSGRRGA